jgi:hypothetical protein
MLAAASFGGCFAALFATLVRSGMTRFITSTGARFLTPTVVFVHRGPSATLGFFLAHALLLVSLSMCSALGFLLVGLSVFVALGYREFLLRLSRVEGITRMGQRLGCLFVGQAGNRKNLPVPHTTTSG